MWSILLCDTGEFTPCRLGRNTKITALTCDALCCDLHVKSKNGGKVVTHRLTLTL